MARTNKKTKKQNQQALIQIPSRYRYQVYAIAIMLTGLIVFLSYNLVSYLLTTVPSAKAGSILPYAATHQSGVKVSLTKHPGTGAKLGTTSKSPDQYLAEEEAALPGSTKKPTLISADLSHNTPPIGYQGQVNSCAAWAVDYYAAGWLANARHLYPAGGFAPMSIYSLVDNGQDNGSTTDSNAAYILNGGVDTRADYWQGDTDYGDLPTASEEANALNYKIKSWKLLFNSTTKTNAKIAAIKHAMSSGNPIILTTFIFQNFYNLSPSNYLISDNGNTAGVGEHAVFADAYDQNGVWIANQWGTGWGLNGYAELSWNYITSYSGEAIIVK